MNRHSYFWWRKFARQLAQEEGKWLCSYKQPEQTADYRPKPLDIPSFQKVHTGRKLKYAMIAVIAAFLSLLTLSVTAWRDHSIKLLMRLDGKTGIINNLDNGLYLPSEMLVPAYIPNGFVVTNFIPLEQGGTLSFENAVGKHFSLTQRGSNDAIKIDTENSIVYENKEVKGQKAILTIKHDDSSQTLYWNTPSYTYELVSNISEKEMLKIAESIPQK